MQGGGRTSRSLCSWQSALICYDGGWLPAAAAPNNYKRTHASLTRRYTLINTNVTLKFTHLLLSPVVQQRQEHGFEGSAVNNPTEARGETLPPVGGPQHRASYLLASGAGLGRPCELASHTLLASSLPMAVMTLMSSSGHSSRSRDRTLDRWVPRFLWMPEHSMQMRAPRFRLAQSGSDTQRHTRSSDGCLFFEGRLCPVWNSL